MIVLVGFMGAGKTTVGHLVAHDLGLPFVDSDLVMEERLGQRIRDVFAERGEAAFRELEQATIDELLSGPPAVVAVGGGAVGHSSTRRALRGALVVFLDVAYELAMARVGGDAGRPMLASPDLDRLFLDRRTLYESVATVTVDADVGGPPQVAGAVLAALRGAADRPRGA